MTRAGVLFSVLGLVAAGAFLGVTVAGWDYYRLPAEARPFHPRHGLLRPAGWAGLLFGVAGTFLFVLNLAYLLRKRFVGATWLGSLRTWIAFHVASGLSGAALIVLHSGYLPRSSLGILALLGLAIVIVTGLVGRYIYAHVPRSIEGRELESEELRRRLSEHRAELETLGVGAQLLDVRVSAAAGDADRGLLARLWGVAAGSRELRRRYRALEREAPPRVLPLARRFCREQQWLARYGELRSLMGSWRFLHRWLAILMLVLAAFHIALAVRFGDLWLLR